MKSKDRKTLYYAAITSIAIYSAKVGMRLPFGAIKLIIIVLKGIAPNQRIKAALSDALNVIKQGPPESYILKNIILNSSKKELQSQFEETIFGRSLNEKK